MGNRKPLRDRFLSRVYPNPDTGCWDWDGALTTAGYGSIGSGMDWPKTLYTHRLAYEMFVAPISDGLTIDHLCKNTACCNPEHMEVVTQGENARRAGGLRKASDNKLRNTHCAHGHLFDEANTYHIKGGGRACRKCVCEATKRNYWRKKMAASA